MFGLEVVVFSDDGTRVAASAWRYFLPVLQWSWAKGASWRTPWRWILEGWIMWECTVFRSLHSIRTPHAWPTLSATRKGVSLELIHCICSCSFIELWRAKVRSELQIHVAACYDLYQKINVLFTCMLTRRSRCLALRFIRCGVASMESHSSMWIKKIKHKDDYGIRSLPSRSFVGWDVDRCRNSASRAMMFKKKCGSKLAGSESSQKSFEMK